MPAITMVRDHLNDLPAYNWPPGYSCRTFRRGEEDLWAAVEFEAGEFESLEAAKARFEMEFAPHLDDMEERCFFLVEDQSGRVIGTTTAWYDRDFKGEDYGRIHWVSVHPEFQGRKLAKPMLAVAMRRLAESHDKAYLVTHPRCWKAIDMYLDFGFVPLVEGPESQAAWKLLAEKLQHPALEGLR